MKTQKAEKVRIIKIQQAYEVYYVVQVYTKAWFFTFIKSWETVKTTFNSTEAYTIFNRLAEGVYYKEEVIAEKEVK